MDERGLRRALDRHEDYKLAEALWMTQFTLLSAAIGYALKSWWAFGIAFFASTVLTWSRLGRRLMAFAASLLWGGIGWEAGRGKDLGMSVVLAIILFVIGFSLNRLAVQVFDERDNGAT